MKKNILYLIIATIAASLVFVTCQEKPEEEDDTNNDPKIQITTSASANFGFKLEVAGTDMVTIKWGDGTAKEIHALSNIPSSYYHSYKKSGIYTITITGDIITLNCSASNAISLDVSQHPDLIRLECSNNRLTNLNISNNIALIYLDCSGNNLTNLDISNNLALASLFCGGNRLTNLEVSEHRALMRLDCSGNRLTNLDVSQNYRLADLNCRNNNLTNLDVSWNFMLENLDCSLNAVSSDDRLSSLDVSNNSMLKILKCRLNGFSDVALNALFETLHNRANTKENFVDIVGNPGTNLCDPSIARSKGWTVILQQEN